MGQLRQLKCETGILRQSRWQWHYGGNNWGTGAVKEDVFAGPVCLQKVTILQVVPIVTIALGMRISNFYFVGVLCHDFSSLDLG